MHDLDTTRIGTQRDFEEDEDVSFEDFEDDEAQSAFEYDDAEPLNEQTELELAQQLLAVENEQELDEFLGKLFRKAVRGVKKFARSKVGRALGGALKSVAKVGLPLAGRALGNFVVPGIGGIVGGQLGSLATQFFELSEASLGDEEAELDAARKFVRLATAASQTAAGMSSQVSPRRAALLAIKMAAQNQMGKDPVASPRINSRGRSQQGRWIRRGNKVILLGL